MIDQNYYAHVSKMIKAIVDNYTHNYFVGKKILDLGSYKGLVAAALHRMGAHVTCLDVRQEHLDHISTQFPGIQVIRANLDDEHFSLDEKFDMVLSLGVMCHLEHWKKHLYDITSLSENIVLETEVLDSNHIDGSISIAEDKYTEYQSYSGEAKIAAPIAIQTVLKELGASFKRLDKKYLNTPSYVYDWQEINSNVRKHDQRRLWFINQSTILKRVFESGAQRREFKPNVPQNIQMATPQIEHRTSSRERRQQRNNIANIPPPQTYSQLPMIRGAESGVLHTDIKNTKIAILINGHLRMFDKTFKSFVNNVLGGNKDTVDVFIHTWDTLGAPAVIDRKHDQGYDTIPTRSKNDLIESVYSPKLMVIDNQCDIKSSIVNYTNTARLTQSEYKGFYGGNLTDYCSMLYSMNQAQLLMDTYEKKNGFKYDIVIKYRPDALSVQHLDFMQYRYNDNIVYTPNIATFYSNGMNDQMAIGNSSIMRSYMSIYTRIIQYLNGRVISPLRPETLLRYHLTNNNIRISTIPWRYYILRCAGGFLFPKGPNMDYSRDQRMIAPYL